MKNLSYILLILMLPVFLSCGNSKVKVENIEKDTLKTQDLLVISDSILKLLQENKFEEFATFIHPDKGARFSASSYIDTINDRILTHNQIIDLSKSKLEFTWGIQEAKGEAIKMNIYDYSKRFIFDVDFLKEGKKQLNKSTQIGSTVNNIAEIFPKYEYVEYFYPGKDKNSEGLDWKILTLIFQKNATDSYLVGVSHCEWTP